MSDKKSVYIVVYTYIYISNYIYLCFKSTLKNSNQIFIVSGENTDLVQKTLLGR